MSNNFFSSHKLKIYHISVAKYVYIIKQGCGANKFTIIFFIPQCGMHHQLLFLDVWCTINFYSVMRETPLTFIPQCGGTLLTLLISTLWEILSTFFLMGYTVNFCSAMCTSYIFLSLKKTPVQLTLPKNIFCKESGPRQCYIFREKSLGATGFLRNVFRRLSF
jgi:hypothetical protein